MLPFGSIFFILKWITKVQLGQKFLISNQRPLMIGLLLVALGCSLLWPIQGLLWERFVQEVVAVVGLILSVIFIRVKSVSLSWPFVALLLISFIPLIQAGAGIVVFRGDAILVFLYLLIFLFSLVLGSSVSRQYGDRSVIQPFCFAVLIVAGLSSVIAIRQWLDLAHSIWEVPYYGARPYANLSQPNHLATLICMGLFSLLFIYERRLLAGFTVFLLAFLLVLGLVLTQSRTAWIILGFAILLRIAFDSHLFFRLKYWTVFLWVAGFIGLSLLVPFAADALGVNAQGVADRAVSSARLSIWRSVIGMIVEGPALGFGWGQIVLAQGEYLDMYPIQGGILYYSHNLFLDIILWNGPWIGLGLVLVLLVWQKRVLSSVRTAEGFAALLIVGSVFVHSMVEYPYAYTYFLIPAGTMLGVLESCYPSSVELSWVWWKRLLVGGLGGAALILTVQEYRYFEQNDFNLRLSQASVIGFEQLELGREVFFLTQLEELQWLRRISDPATVQEQSLPRMAAVTARYPQLSNMYRYALALAVHERYIAAAGILQHLRLIHGDKFYLMALDQIETKLGTPVLNELDRVLEDSR